MPTTAILDTFDRANSTTTAGANWTALESGANKDRGISSNQLYDPDAVYSWIYWNVAQYGPNCEVYATVSTWPSAAEPVILYLRLKEMTQDAYAFDGYGLWAATAQNELRIYRVDNSTPTLIGAAVSVTLAAGDQLWFKAEGATLTGYQNGVERISRTDATYTNAGYLGIYAGADSTWRLDNFGGGTLLSPPPRPQMRLPMAIVAR
jgi:hypothetical protein